MELKDYLKLLNKKKETIVLLILFFLIAGAIITFIQPFRYEAASKILITQNRGPVDPYVITKTNEYVAKVLTNVVSSDLFFKELVGGGYNIDSSYFFEERIIRKNKWNETAMILSNNDSGLLIIKVLHEDKKEAEKIAEAITHLLKIKNSEYHGIGSVIGIKVLDPPAVSNLPVRPNIIFNLALSFTLGLIFGFIYIYLFPEKRYDLKFWPFSSEKEIRDNEQDGWVRAASIIEKKKEDNIIYNEINYKQIPARAETELRPDYKIEEADFKINIEAEKEERENLDGPEREDEFEDKGLTYGDFIKKADIRNILG
jgi:capsular polysaccharide biosynthesis protein